VLLEDFLKPMGVSRYRLANGLGVTGRQARDVGTGGAHDR
jgi:plasmid maintenance system antidote protein VapI